VLNSEVYSRFADWYDVMYAHRNYERDCDAIELAIRNFSKIRIRSILDVGCGTGRHALILAKRGYHVTGIDLSLPMVKIAVRNAKTLQNVRFYTGNVLNFDLQSKFDCCISMFATLSYLREYHEIGQAFSQIKKHLKKGGIFIFDVWNGLGVLSQKPRVNVKITSNKAKGRLIRIATPYLNEAEQICSVNYHFIVIKENQVLDEFEETHDFRFFFPAEIRSYLESNGFQVASIYSDLLEGIPANESSWYLTVVAMAGS
jgi:SAM-dependent methyltransferase